MKRIFLILSIGLFALATAACGAATTESTTEATTTSTTVGTTTSESVVSTSIFDRVKELTNPFNVALYVNGNPETYVNVNFELPASDSGIVEYRSEAEPAIVHSVAAEAKTTVVGDETVHTFAAAIGPLVPGEAYSYRVGNAAGDVVDEWRDYVAPASDPDSFSFAVFADPQENDRIGYMAFAHAGMSVLEYSEADIAFSIFVGDFVNDHEVRDQWDWFLRYSSFAAMNVPIAATVGNHEYGAISGERMTQMEYDAYTNLPANGPTYGPFDELADDHRQADVDRGKTYSFDYGGVHFVALDTEIFCDGTTACADRDETNAQILADWLAADLAAAETDRIVVFMHRGPYSATYDTSFVRATLPAIFEEYGVDLVFSGHDHQYSRAVYRDGAAVPFGRADAYPLGTVSLLGTLADAHLNDYPSSIGPTYLVGNTAGTKFYDKGDASGVFLQVVYGGNNPVVPIVTVTADAIEVVSYVLYKNNPTEIVPSGVGIFERFTIR